MTNWTAINTFEDLLISANSHSPFWVGMLLMMWIVLVISFMSLGYSIAIIGGSFLAFVLGLFLMYMGLVSWKWVLALFGVIIITIILDILFGRKEG